VPSIPPTVLTSKIVYGGEGCALLQDHVFLAWPAIFIQLSNELIDLGCRVLAFGIAFGRLDKLESVDCIARGG